MRAFVLILLTLTLRSAAADASCEAKRSKGQSLLQAHVQHTRVEGELKSKFLPTEIRRQYINVNAVQYSRKGAEGARLGSLTQFGLLGFPPTVDFEAPSPKSWLKNNVRADVQASITSEQKFTLGITASVKYAGMEASGSFGVNSTHSAGMTLQKLEFDDEWKIIRWLNKEKNADFVQQFRRLHYPRIVMAVWVMLDQHTPEIGHECIGGSLSLQYQGMGGSISAEGCGSSTWTFNSGTVVAYRLGKVVFGRDGKAIKIDEDSGTR